MKITKTIPKVYSLVGWVISSVILILVLCVGADADLWQSNFVGTDREPYYYSGGRKVFLEAVEGEYLVETAVETSEVKLTSELQGDDTSASALYVPEKKLARVTFLPVKSPYRVIQEEDLVSGEIEPLVKTKPPKNYRRILWKTPVVRRTDSGQKVYVLNRIVVKFHGIAEDSEIIELLSNYPVCDTKTASRRKGRYVLVVHPQHVDNVFEIANELYENHLTLYAHPDFVEQIRLSSVGDPNFPEQWHLHNSGGSSDLVDDVDIDAREAWALSTDPTDWDTFEGALGTHGITVAVLDDSVDIDHPDLSANYIGGRDFDNSPYDDDPSPDGVNDDHGTACAGVAVARANSIGVRGSAPWCTLLGIKAGAPSVSAMADAFEWAADNRASILSNSWSWNRYDDVVDAINNVALNGREGKGCVVLFAAANDYGNIIDNNPYAALGETVCVGAITSMDTHSLYSNTGPEMDIVAPSSPSRLLAQPGRAVTTTDVVDGQHPTDGYNWGQAGEHPDTNYTNDFGGTSSATPLVAGVAALVLSANPDLDANEVKQILYDTADLVNDPCYLDGNGDPIEPNYSEHFGHGRVNAYKAVKKALISHYTTGDLRLQDIVGVDWSMNPVTISAGETFELTDLVLDSNQRQYIDRVIAAWLVLDTEDVDNGTEISVLSNWDRLLSHCPPTGSGQRRPVIMSIPPDEIVFQGIDEPFKLKNNDFLIGHVKLYGATLRLFYVSANSETDANVTGGFRFPTGEPGSATGWSWGYLDSNPFHVTNGDPLEEHANTSTFYNIADIKAARAFVTGRAIGRGEVTLKVNGTVIGTLPMVTDDDSSVRTRYIGVPINLLSNIVISGDNTITLEGSDAYIYNWGMAFDYAKGQIDPQPDIKVNGLDGVVTVSKGDSFDVSLSVDPGTYDGHNVDWWFSIFYYDFSIGQWISTHSGQYQDPLFNLSQALGPFDTSGIPESVPALLYYWAVDMDMNGQYDSGQAFFDVALVLIDHGIN